MWKPEPLKCFYALLLRYNPERLTEANIEDKRWLANVLVKTESQQTNFLSADEDQGLKIRW